jgi:tRNA(Ile2) C34 agmatinyltransferase TiaS
MSDLIGHRCEVRDSPPCGRCGSTRSSKSTVGEHYFCLDCGDVINPTERTDDPRQMDFLA